MNLVAEIKSTPPGVADRMLFEKGLDEGLDQNCLIYGCEISLRLKYSKKDCPVDCREGNVDMNDVVDEPIQNGLAVNRWLQIPAFDEPSHLPAIEWFHVYGRKWHTFFWCDWNTNILEQFGVHGENEAGGGVRLDKVGDYPMTYLVGEIKIVDQYHEATNLNQLIKGEF